MKYVLAGLAVVAAIAALFFRPPQGSPAPRPVAELGSPVATIPRAARAVGSNPSTGPRPTGQGRLVVYVAGEVLKPGVYALDAGARAEAALRRAGGPKPDADLVAVNLAAPVTDGEEIAIPRVGAEPPRRHRLAVPRVRASHQPRRHRGRPSNGDAARPQSVDLNSADEAELETLPGIGPALAARIVAYRETNGPFTSVDELADISGISPGLQDKITDYLVVR
jgi:competence protein ComEA